MVLFDAGVTSMLGLFHWMLGVLNTPSCCFTLHVSEYEVPATLDPSPDTLTIPGASTTEVYNSYNKNIIGMLLATNSPGVTGPTTGLGKSAKATREILWTPPTGRSVSSCLLSLSRLSMVTL